MARRPALLGHRHHRRAGRHHAAVRAARSRSRPRRRPGGAIDLSWTAATDNVAVTGYKLYRGTAPGVYGTPVQLLANVTSYTDSTAVTGTPYYYAVSALDAAGNEGPKSPEVSIAAVDNTPPDTTQPSAPAALSASDHAGDTGGAIDLSWTAATDNVAVTGYKLYRGTSPGTYGTPVTLSNVTSYTDSTAVTGTTYYYAVAALDAAGNEGPKSPESSASAADNTPPPDTTQPTAPATLLAVDHAGDAGGAIDLSWTAATDNVAVTGYKLYRGTSPGVYGTPVSAHQRHELHRLHRGDRHDLLLRGLRTRRGRQRGAQVARGLRERGERPAALITDDRLRGGHRRRDPALPMDGRGLAAARRVRHRPGQERHASRPGSRDLRPRPTAGPTRPPRRAWPKTAPSSASGSTSTRRTSCATSKTGAGRSRARPTCAPVQQRRQHPRLHEHTAM